MPQIAIIRAFKYDDSYECSCPSVVESITDWDEVSEEELMALNKNIHKLNRDYTKRHFIIERITVESMKPTVANFLKELKKEEQRQKELDDKRKEKKAKAKETRLAKQREKELSILEAIKQKYGLVEA